MNNMNSDIKLVAINLDGNALNSEHEMSLTTLTTLKKLADYNIKLVIASGRPLYQIKSIIDKLVLNNINDFRVAFNGVVVAEELLEKWGDKFKICQEIRNNRTNVEMSSNLRGCSC
ncbi:hypothetical protein P344_02270 [Spiroplasma mirum ATCC 29335]|uniref:Uncharacterized protein n=2 Tax=Spiroplasma mirum TaxID=2144 RepID=W0GQK3_9MOLU|nr:C-terminal truncated HAD superfamily hydrolase [Spiroplasma mirum ATCC 29335]AHI57802.1 hypothetical protein P344_02270 [Spiroplasma mirum ATCC 29335]